MQGVTTAIVFYIFVCTFFPHMIRNRPQFYAGVIAVIAAMLLNTLAAIIGGEGFTKFALAFSLFLETVTFVLMIVSTGGVSLAQLKKEVGNVIEVVRRGESEKEIIIPRSSQQPRVRDEDDEDEITPRPR